MRKSGFQTYQLYNLPKHGVPIYDTGSIKTFYIM